MREKTTKKQRELLTYLEAFIKQNNFSPSYREIMNAMGYKSVSTVASHVDNLVERGYIKKGSDGIRALEIVPAPSESNEHKAWLKRALNKKLRQLEGENSASNKQDIEAIKRVVKLFGLE